MWALRRVTGRRLWERPWDDELDLDPNSSDPTRAALGAIAAANAVDPAGAPGPVAPARYVASRHRKREIVASPTPVLDLRRRTQAQPVRPLRRRRRVTAVGVAAAVLVLAAAVLGMGLLLQGPRGQVFAATGRPQSSRLLVVPSSGSAPPPSATVPRSVDTTAPTTAIVRVTKAAIPGHALMSVSIRWVITDAGSGVQTELFQWRTDNDPWVTAPLPSSTTRTVTLRLPPGHRYSFRIRGVDRSANVGSFAVRDIRI